MSPRLSPAGSGLLSFSALLIGFFMGGSENARSLRNFCLDYTSAYNPANLRHLRQVPVQERAEPTGQRDGYPTKNRIKRTGGFIPVSDKLGFPKIIFKVF